MKVVLTTPGRFHTFVLARKLLQLGILDRVISGFPKVLLDREGIPRDKLFTHPWPQVLRHVTLRSGLSNRSLRDYLAYYGRENIDRYAARHMGTPDIYVALSGSGLLSGQAAQAGGAKWICDRGSCHIQVQDRLLHEEYARNGQHYFGIDPRTLERELHEYERADAITVPSQFARSTFIEMGVSPAKVHCVPYGGDTHFFSPVGTPNPDQFDVLFVGALSYQKGIPDLFAAFRRLKHPAKRLILIGSQTQDWQYLQRNMPPNTEIRGHVPHAHLKTIMSSAHVLVLPSIQDGFGMVMGEALACGCPVIASENTGARDLYTDGEEGYIVPTRDPTSIADRLQHIADSPTLRENMSEKALAHMQILGGTRQYAEHMVSVFQNVLR